MLCKEDFRCREASDANQILTALNKDQPRLRHHTGKAINVYLAVLVVDCSLHR